MDFNQWLMMDLRNILDLQRSAEVQVWSYLPAALAVTIAITALMIVSNGRSRLKFKQGTTSSHHHVLAPMTVSEKKTISSLDEPLYLDVLPPSRRHILRDLKGCLSETLRKHPEYDQIAVPQASVRQYTPHDRPFEMFPGNMFSPTGFTVNEIRQMKTFPDYAALSGVPLPEAYESFEIDKAIPRPYRPFRWAYHQTMSLTKMEPDWWLELESTYAERVRQRQELYKKHGKMVLQYLPGSEHACRELMEMVCVFLCARYPQYFTLTSQDASTDRPTHLANKILGTTTDLAANHPLHVLLDNIPEDFAIVQRNPQDGIYYMRAGLICSSLGWNVDSKIGKKLADIHGPVPDYREKMKFSMDRYFAKMPTDMPIQRGSWGLEIDEPLFMPPGDPHEAYRDYQLDSLQLKRIHLRVDWQTLRRLPLSGGIVFNFKAVFTPLTKFADEPYIPALTLKILNEGKENIMKYKNCWHVEHVAKPALEEMKRRQVERGWVEKDWEEKTLEQSPFFPGWEKQWRHEQGF